MGISKRRKGHHHRHHKRLRIGGYISGSNERGVGYDKRTELRARERKKEDDATKFGLFRIPTWLDAKVNKHVPSEDAMKRLQERYNTARNSLERQTAKDMMKDLLISHDIKENPDDYLREWQKGKHKRNNWVKWLARAGLGAAGVAAGYGLYQYGLPFLSGLFKSGSSAVAKVASCIASTDAAAQGVPKSSMNTLIEYIQNHPDDVDRICDTLGIAKLSGSGYWGRRRLKRRKHHKRK